MKRIFPTILFVFIIITLFTIPTIPKNKTMRTNLEIDSNITFPQQKIYVKNKDNYFVQIEVFITNKDSPEEIIEYLKIDNNHLSTEWNGYIPKEVKIREYKMNNNHLEIHFSEELKKIDFKDLSGLYYSLKEMKRVEEVTIYIENELIEKIPSINLEEEIKDRNNIDQVVLYYIDNIDNKNYVPVTKYKDSSEEKIDYIITSLKENIPNNLISFVNNHLKLISYEMDNNTMVLNFNESLLEDQDNKELILEEIAYSIMDNFDVTTVLFYVNGTYQEMITNKA